MQAVVKHAPEEIMFDDRTLSWVEYVRIYRCGIRVQRWKRNYLIDPETGLWYPYARVVWAVHNPFCMAQPNEEIHHRDLNRLNDDITNLQKLTKAEHDELHQRQLVVIPEEVLAELQFRFEHTDERIEDIARDLSERHGVLLGKRRAKSICRKFSRSACAPVVI
jgi:hypothetical protein